MIMDWYYALNGKQQGPVNEEQVRELVQRGVLRAPDLVWCQSMAAWTKVEDTPELSSLLIAVGAPRPVSVPMQPVDTFNPSDVANDLYGGRDNDVSFQPSGPSRQSPYDINRPRQVKTYLVESILATLFCCLPLGIVAIINAAQANSALGSGNYGRAEELAERAKQFMWYSVIVGVVANLIGFIIGFAQGFSSVQ